VTVPQGCSAAGSAGSCRGAESCLFGGAPQHPHARRLARPHRDGARLPLDDGRCAALAEYGIETAFHLGAQTLVGVAKVDPVCTLEANVRGTWLLLEAARQAGVKQVLVASSDKAYGDSSNLPYFEDHPLQGRFPYDVSKSCTDLITTMYARTFGLGACIVRCGNLFGGGDLNFSRLIPGVIRATVRNEPFRIRSDGKFVRDFLYGRRRRLPHARRKMAADPSPGRGVQLRRSCGHYAGAHGKVRHDGQERPASRGQNVARRKYRAYRCGQGAKPLGWTPRHGMDEGLQRTIDWYRRFLAEEAS
jgi:CDP-glucose 4,6-dehydratase